MASLVQTVTQDGGQDAQEKNVENFPWPGGNLVNIIRSPKTNGFSSLSLWSLLGEDDDGPDIFLYAGTKILGRLKHFFEETDDVGFSCVTHISHAWHTSNILICTYGMHGGIFQVTKSLDIIRIDSFRTHFQTLDSAISLWDNTYACVCGGQDGALLRFFEYGEGCSKVLVGPRKALYLKEGICACCIVATANRIPYVALAGKDGRCFMLHVNVEALVDSTSTETRFFNEFSIVVEQGEGRITHANFSPCDQFISFSFWNGHCRVYKSATEPSQNVWLQFFVIKNPGTAVPTSAPSFSYWVPYRDSEIEKFDDTPLYIFLFYEGKSKSWGIYDLCTSSRLYDLEFQVTNAIGKQECFGVTLGYDDPNDENSSIRFRAFTLGQNGGKSSFETVNFSRI